VAIQVNEAPEDSSVTVHVTTGNRGCLILTREPARNGPSSSRVIDVTDGVQPGQFSTSTRTSHTRSGAAATTVMSALTAAKRSVPGLPRLRHL
jgi:hypothetical protein